MLIFFSLIFKITLFLYYFLYFLCFIIGGKMKLKYLSICFSVLLLLSACHKDPEPVAQNVNNKEFIRPVQETVENYISGHIIKETTNFTYEKSSDYFWTKAETKDSTGKVIHSVIRTLAADRTPLTEVVTDEFGSSSEKYKVKYSAQTYDLLEKTEYKGDFNEQHKVKTTKFNYQDAYLMSEEVTTFAKDPNFKNIDGNNIADTYTIRFLPNKMARPKGFFETYSLIEKRRKYYTPEFAARAANDKFKIGDVYISTDTKFDADGMPISSKSINPTLGKDKDEQEWYQTEKDGLGNLMSITAYANEAMDKLTDNSTKITFEYNDKGIITKISDYFYNAKTKNFDKFHNEESFAWVDPQVASIHNFNDANHIIESYCWNSLVYSKSEYIVQKYDKSEKIVIKKLGSKPGNESRPNIATNIDSKITTKFETVQLGR